MALFSFDPSCTEAEDFGLSYYECCQIDPIERDIPVTFESVLVQVSIIHVAALVEIQQKYVHSKNWRAQAAYTFPLPSSITITQFRVEINGKTIRGVVKTKGDAKRQYIKALEEHRTDLLAEEETNKDVFRVDIGSIEPEDQITVYLTYITEIGNEIGKDSVEFSLPQAIVPNSSKSTETVSGGNQSSSSKKKFSQSDNVSIKVKVSLEGNLAKIESPSHNVSVSQVEPVPGKISWTTAFVDVTAQAKDMNRDFVLLISPEEVERPRVYSEKIDDKSLAVMAHLIPKLESDEQKVELILAMDRSGSMEGNTIKMVQSALLVFLHSIPVDSYFNIVGFGNAYEFLFPESAQYNEENLSKALHHIKNIVTNTGGFQFQLSELFSAIFNKTPVPGYLRQLFLLTDNEQILNTEDIISLISTNVHNTRVSLLGIGESVSKSLLDKIAKAGNGISDFVSDNEQMDVKLLDQLKIALTPSLTDINVKWDGFMSVPGSESHQAPRKIAPLFNGFPLLVFGIFYGKIPTGISISGTSPDGMLSVKIPIDEERDSGDSGLIRGLATMKIIRELEKESETLICNGNIPFEEQGAYQDYLKDKIVSLSCENGIISKYTSYVMIDESKRTQDFHSGTIQQRRIPLQPTNSCCKKSTCCLSMKCEDTGPDYILPTEPEDCFPASSSANPGLSKLCSSEACVQDLSVEAKISAKGEKDLRSLLSYSNYQIPLHCSKSLCAKKTENVQNYIDCDSFRQELEIDDFRDDLSATSESPLDFFSEFEDDGNCDCHRGENEIVNQVHEFALLQSFSGSFELTEELCDAISIAELLYIQLESRENDWDDTAWATVLAIVYLTTRLSHLQSSWDLIVIKAEKWLMKNHSEVLEGMVASAQTLLN